MIKREFKSVVSGDSSFSINRLFVRCWYNLQVNKVRHSSFSKVAKVIYLSPHLSDSRKVFFPTIFYK